MNRLILAMALAAALRAQNLEDVLKRGEEVFSHTCATGYCHAAKGAVAGGAPRLAARGFTQAYLATTVAQGIPGTAMPAFSGSLPIADRAAVVAYLATLNGIAAPSLGGASAAPTPVAPRLTAEESQGRALFSEATRGMGRCSTCHEVNRIGMPVAAPIATIPSDANLLKLLATPNIATATVDGDTMPILMIGSRTQGVAFYDLTVAPPVLRTVSPSAIQIRDVSSWKHSSVISAYTDPELAAILAYLRTAK